MADQPNIVVTGDSREAVAYALFLGIAREGQSPNHRIRTVTAMHRKSGATECYFAGHPLESPRYWLRRLEQDLVEKKFGEWSPQDRARADRRYGATQSG